MSTALTHGVWPDALTCTLPRDCLRLGWLGAADDPVLANMCELLAERITSEIVTTVFLADGDGCVGFEVLNGDECGHHNAVHSDQFAHQVASLDVMILPEEALSVWWDTLRRWAIPPILLSNHSDEGVHAIKVCPEDPRATAAYAALLLTDPPTRRRSLELLFDWQPYMAFPKGAWRVEGVFDSSYSLALVNRQLAMALDLSTGGHGQLLTYEQGAPASINTAGLVADEQRHVEALWNKLQNKSGAPKVALRNAWPPTVRGMRGQLRVLANYAWEETRFPSHFVDQFNETLDLITTVSSQTARFLEDAGVKVPIAVVGNGVDHLTRRKPAKPPQKLPGGFRFLHVSSCFPRKAIDTILAAFTSAFSASDDVVLIVKTFPNPHNDIQSQLTALREARDDLPEVVVFEDDWTEGQIAGLYQACDAFVAPSRGEGFGLPLAEAMLFGLPVVASDWGGHRDFCSPNNSWLVPTTLVPATTHLSATGSLWAEPNQQALEEILLALYEEDSSTWAGKLEQAKTDVGVLTWNAAARKTRHAVEQLSWTPAPLPAVRLGWLTTWRERCGIYEYSQHMTHAMRPGGEQSFDVALTVFAPTDGWQRDDEPFVNRCWQRQSNKPLSQMVREAVTQQLDAVVIQYHWGFFTPEALVDTVRGLKGAGIAVFLDMHNTQDAPPAFIEGVNLRHGLACCDRVLVHTLADMAVAESWGLKDNLTLLPLASYPIKVPTPATVATQREAMGLRNKKVIATYGFLMGHKGCNELVEALPAILRKHPDAHLLLINASYSEQRSAPVIAQIESTIERLGLNDKVTCKFDFLPEEESMLLLKSADLVVYPYQESTESSSAAVRMAISGRCLVAITPLSIFADVASACITLPGVTPKALAKGVSDILKGLNDQNYSTDYLEGVDRFAQDLSSEVLSKRVLGMITGHLRRMEVQ